jgi:NDP-sugar pyrophosphorylase family protein
MVVIVIADGVVPHEADLGALLALHNDSDAIVTIGVETSGDVNGRDVVVTGSDGRVVGYQRRAHPAEALSDVVDTGVHVVSGEAFDYLSDRSPGAWSPDAITTLLESDVPVYAAPLGPIGLDAT